MSAAHLVCPHAGARAWLATTPQPPGSRVWCRACGAWFDVPAPRAPNVYRAPAASAAGDADVPVRAGPRPTLSAEDRELARVRVLLCALRPDCAEPLLPPPPALTAAPTVRVRDPMAGWGDVPSGLTDTGEVRVPDAGQAAKAAAVMARLATLEESARVVLTWLRHHARLLDARGQVSPRGLYVDVGRAFAGDELAALWGRDLTAQRDGAAALGRRLVLAAAAAWEAGTAP